MHSKINTLTKRKQHMIEWWFGTVAFAFLPILFLSIFSLLKTGTVNIASFIFDGDIILVAFTITFPTVTKIRKSDDVLFYILSFFCSVELCIYGAISVMEKPSSVVVWIATLVCLFFSILFSHIGEKCSEKGAFERV